LKLKKTIILIICLTLSVNIISQTKKLKLGVDGLSHGHVVWVFKHNDTTTFDLVGIAEPNRDLAERLSKRFGFSMDIVYPNLEEMLDKTKPEAVAAFNATYEHLNTLKQCAPRGIHVMVEKPLAINYKHAEQMASLSRKYQIHLITNYETTWYPSHQFVNQVLNKEKKIGRPRRIIVNDGHEGPQEINVSDEFLEWLTDPDKNGGGAITDFGCYGANLITWLKEGEMPTYVYATASSFKPDIYSKVDDDATILLEYEGMTGVLQPSWNWPYSRKDIEVYGETGYVIAHNHADVSYKLERQKPELQLKLKDRDNPNNNAFDFFKAVVQGTIILDKNDLSGLDNNLKVVRILDAARKSVATGKKVRIDDWKQ
jgi:predicted dehydrogenase